MINTTIYNRINLINDGKIFQRKGVKIFLKEYETLVKLYLFTQNKKHDSNNLFAHVHFKYRIN